MGARCRATYSAQPEKKHARTIHVFNGRLDAPYFRALSDMLWDIAKYDFSKGIYTDEILDVSGSDLDGVLVNAPTLAIRGYDYDHNLVGMPEPLPRIHSYLSLGGCQTADGLRFVVHMLVCIYQISIGREDERSFGLRPHLSGPYKEHYESDNSDSVL